MTTLTSVVAHQVALPTLGKVVEPGQPVDVPAEVVDALIATGYFCVPSAAAQPVTPVEATDAAASDLATANS